MTRSNNISPKEAYSRLADRCAMTEMSTGEALEKLRRLGITQSEAYSIVQKLVDERFIDDERFARMYVRDKLVNARWGRIKISQSLRLKGVDSEIAAEAFESVWDDQVYFRNLAAALRNKARTMGQPLTYPDKVKLVKFAAGRGYEPELIREMLADEDYWRDPDNC